MLTLVRKHNNNPAHMLYQPPTLQQQMHSSAYKNMAAIYNQR